MTRGMYLVVGLLFAAAACQGETGSGGSTSAPTAAATVASNATAPAGTLAPTKAITNDEPPQPTPIAPTAPLTAAAPGQPGAVPPNPTLTLAVTPASNVTKAEDGSGAVVAASNPVFLDVGGGVGGQALGPELSVGQLRFREHSYPSPGVVRFTCANKTLLPTGAEVALVYGAKRIVVSTSLVVP